MRGEEELCRPQDARGQILHDCMQRRWRLFPSAGLVDHGIGRLDGCNVCLVLLAVGESILGSLFLLRGDGGQVIAAHALFPTAFGGPAGLGEPLLGKSAIGALVLDDIGNNRGRLLQAA